MGTCRSARQASWEEVAAVNESPLLTLGNLVLRWHSDLGIPRNGALLFSRPCPYGSKYVGQVCEKSASCGIPN